MNALRARALAVIAAVCTLVSCDFSGVGSDSPAASSSSGYSVHIRRVTVSTYTSGSTTVNAVPAYSTTVTVEILSMGSLSILYTLSWDDASLFSYTPTDCDSTVAGCQPVAATSDSSFSFYFTAASGAAGKDIVLHIAKYAPDKGISFSTDTVTIHVASYCTVTLDANGGTSMMSTVSGYEGASVYLSSSYVYWSGYTLTGWNTKADGSGTAYDSGSVTVTGNLTLYAQWAANSYVDGNLTYTYDSGYGTYYVSSYASTASDASVSIPSSIGSIKVTSLASSLFQSRTEIASVSLPSSLLSIGSSAFASCSALTSITIPATVTSIGADAFSSCSALSKVVFGADTPPDIADSTAFSDCAASLVFWVPAAGLSAYATAFSTVLSGVTYTISGY